MNEVKKPMLPPTTNGQFQSWVVSELGEIKTDLRYLSQTQLPAVEERLTNARLDIRELKTRALIGGGIAGLIASAGISLALHLLFGA